MIESADGNSVKSCLIIEDSVVQIKLIEAMFDKNHWQVQKAYCLEDAIFLLESTPLKPSLIMCDLVLPDAEFGASASKARELEPAAIICAMSASGENLNNSTLLAKAKNEGASFLLNKPFSKKRFDEFIKEVEYRLDNENRLIHALIIDDSNSICSICTKILAQFDFRVTISNNIDETLKDIDLFDVDLIFCDLNMPGIDPKTALPKIRLLFPDVKIIAMSGNDDELEIMKEFGADALLSKPFDAQSVIAAIESLD